jgi:hypothetical protein
MQIQEGNDPESGLSKAAREVFRNITKRTGVEINIPENISYSRLIKMFPYLSNIITAESNKMYKEEKAARDRSEAEEKRQTKLEDKQRAFIERAQKDLARKREGLEKIELNIDKIRSEDFNNADPMQQIGLIYQYIKALDKDSAVREGEIDLILSGSPYTDKAFNFISKLNGNPDKVKLISKEQMRNIRDQILQLSESEYGNYRRLADQKIALGKDLGLTEDYYTMIDPLYNRPKVEDAPKYSQQQEAIIKKLMAAGNNRETAIQKAQRSPYWNPAKPGGK